MITLSRRQIISGALAGLMAAQLACELFPDSWRPDVLPPVSRPTATITATTTLFEAMATIDAVTATPIASATATATATSPATATATPPAAAGEVDLAQLLSGVLAIESKMVWDPAQHRSFIQLPDQYNLEAVFAPQAAGDPLLDLLGDEPVADTEMTEFVDGYETIVIETKGRGTVAGFPEVEVSFNGLLSPFGLFGYYKYGSDGSLPTGQSAMYQVLGQWLKPRPDDEDELDEGLEDFLDRLYAALRANDGEFLLGRLHPVVLAVYGLPQCRYYMTNRVADPQEAVVPQGAGALGDWAFEADGVSIVVPGVLTIPALTTRDGATTTGDVHFAPIHGRYTWFTDCGAKLP